MKRTKTLIIASCGLEQKHITLETMGALKKCGTVFSHCLDAADGGFIAKACARFESLREVPRYGMAARLKEAFREHDVVGFLTYGNPLFLNRTTARLTGEMAASGIRVTVLPAVSSFDSIVNLMDLNIFSPAGLRLVDTGPAVKDLKIAAEMDTLFFVAGELNAPGCERARGIFLKKLEAAYPGRHPVFLINLPCIGSEPERLVKTTVSGLKTVLSGADRLTTILVRAYRKKKRGGKRTRARSSE